MIGISWWLVDHVSRLLQPDERDAVRGDLTELGVSGGKALCDLLGLVVRRQARVWTDWRPWLALVGLVAPLGLVLSLVSRYWADASAIYAWLYVNNWTWGYLESPGARLDLVHVSATFIIQCATLICWAWTLGFALGSLSRRAVWVNGVLFALVLLGGPFDVAALALRNPANAAVFSVTFYRVWFPILLRIVFVLLPALWGMHQGPRIAALSVGQAISWAGAVTTLTLLATQSLEMSVILGWWSLSGDSPSVGGFSQLRDSWPLRLLPVSMMWPAGYMVATARWRRWHERTTTAG